LTRVQPVLAAAHAFDSAPTQFEFLVSDPIAGRSEAELRRNCITVLDWSAVVAAAALPINRTRWAKPSMSGRYANSAVARRGRSAPLHPRHRIRIYFMSRAITRRAGLQEGGHHEDER
jgi:hypothetical protein